MSHELSFLLLPGVFWLMLIPILVFQFRRTAVLPVSSVFYWCLLGVFLIYTPLSDYLLGIREYFGFRLPYSHEINKTIARVYSLAMVGFAAGQIASFFLPAGRLFTIPVSDRWPGEGGIRLLYGYQLAVWLLYFFNLLASGISIGGLFNPFHRGEDGILFSAAFSFPLLELLSASVPVCLFLLMALKQYRKPVWWLFFLFWLLMSLLGGWRFRIILFGLFCLLLFVESGYRKKGFLLYLLLFVFSMAWLTLNRMAIAKRQFELVTFDLRQFDGSVFNNEFSNCRTFRACLSMPQADSFPGFRGWMKEGQAMKPWIIQFSKSWIPEGWPWNPNPALSQPEEFYLLFGLPGLLLLMVFSGMLTACLDRMRYDLFSRLFALVFTALLFQWISRGYFPFQLKITLICLLPFLLLWFAGPYLSPKSDGNKT